MQFEVIRDCRYVVIGDPVEHSVSPPMQNAAFNSAGHGSPYGKIRVSEAELPEFTAYARTHLLGFNITVPHKQAIIPFLDEVTPEAAAAESVNTVTVRDGRLLGASTDGYGLETALAEAFDFRLKGGKIAFVGCGGAVQAVAYHFAANGIAAMYFINRTVEKAEELQRRLSARYPVETACCGLEDSNTVKQFLSSATVLIQGSSLGLKADDPSPLPAKLLTPTLCCYDTIYKNTAFLRQARERGLQTADGRTMLLHQGARSFAIWTGSTPDVAAMRTALDRALANR